MKSHFKLVLFFCFFILISYKWIQGRNTGNDNFDFLSNMDVKKLTVGRTPASPMLIVVDEEDVDELSDLTDCLRKLKKIPSSRVSDRVKSGIAGFVSEQETIYVGFSINGAGDTILGGYYFVSKPSGAKRENVGIGGAARKSRCLAKYLTN